MLFWLFTYVVNTVNNSRKPILFLMLFFFESNSMWLDVLDDFVGYDSLLGKQT